MVEECFPLWDDEVDITTEMCAALQLTHYQFLLVIFPHDLLACHLKQTQMLPVEGIGMSSEMGTKPRGVWQDSSPLDRLRVSWARLSPQMLKQD